MMDDKEMISLASKIDSYLKNYPDEEVELILTVLRALRRLRELAS